MKTNQTIEFKKNTLLPLLFGEHNAHLNYLEEKLGISIADRGNQLTLQGDKKSVQTAENVLHSLLRLIEKKQEVGTAEIDAELRFIDAGVKKGYMGKDKQNQHTAIQTKKKTIEPRSPNQAKYLKQIFENEMVFGLGPAGTGKTYLAVAAGVRMFLDNQVEKLIFCRPAVEAGENLGFLPGDMQEKVEPYLRPIYDAMHEMMDLETVTKKMESGDIEIAPLAFMRGRTLKNAFVLLDEAQNTTTAQMKMFLTRMGENSRMVIAGDLSQTDLPKGVESGLRDAVETLKGVDDIKFMNFTGKDVVRHKLVGKIVDAYEQKKAKPTDQEGPAQG